MTTTKSGLDAALERVGDRWSLLIIDALAPGPARFGELEIAIGGIAPNVLSARLRRMAGDGIIDAAAYTTRPVRLRYELTEQGRGLLDAARLLAGWGANASGGIDATAAAGRHGACGTALEARLWCPTCAAVVEEHDDGLHHV